MKPTEIKYSKFDEENIKEINESKYIDNYPVVYILKDQKAVYIGESAQFNQRMKSHKKNIERKRLTDLIVLSNEMFNKSATYNIETNLINSFIADGRYKILNSSQTTMQYTHNYFGKNTIQEVVFPYIWDKLYSDKIVNNDLDIIRNSDVYKLSPFKELSLQQLELKKEVLKFCKKNINNEKKSVFVIKGEAGSGKSVVISSIFNTLQDESKTNSSSLYQSKNFILVNHGEMIKTYEKMSESLPNIQKKQILKPTVFLNKSDDYYNSDITIVDEAHLLLSSSDSYNGFNENNHLEEIIKKSKITIIVFDPNQVLKLKSVWDTNRLMNVLKGNTISEFALNEQFRMRASKSTKLWIDNFLINRKVDIIPSDSSFELKIFEDCLDMFNKIVEKNELFGLCRMASTFDFKHLKSGKEIFTVDSGRFSLPWNNQYKNTTWAEAKESINEVGSIYTLQGFDLNYVGLILGPSVVYSKSTKSFKIDVSKYQDTGAMAKPKNLIISEEEKIKLIESIIMNSINILMKRGIRGCYIHFSRVED